MEEPAATNLSQLVSPTSLEELFARDPEKLSEQDIQVIVRTLREKRLSWAIEEQQAKAQERRPRAAAGAKEPKPKKEKVKLDLSQLKIQL